MERVTIIGVDLAKNVFPLHGAAEVGSPVFGRQLSRLQFCKFMAGQTGMCRGYGSVRQLPPLGPSDGRLGHEPTAEERRRRAEAIVEAAQRSTMRFVEPKTKEQQSGYRVSHQRAVRESANRIGECAARAPL